MHCDGLLCAKRNGSGLLASGRTGSGCASVVRLLSRCRSEAGCCRVVGLRQRCADLASGDLRMPLDFVLRMRRLDRPDTSCNDLVCGDIWKARCTACDAPVPPLGPHPFAERCYQRGDGVTAGSLDTVAVRVLLVLPVCFGRRRGVAVGLKMDAGALGPMPQWLLALHGRLGHGAHSTGTQHRSGCTTVRLIHIRCRRSCRTVITHGTLLPL